MRIRYGSAGESEARCPRKRHVECLSDLLQQCVTKRARFPFFVVLQLSKHPCKVAGHLSRQKVAGMYLNLCTGFEAGSRVQSFKPGFFFEVLICEWPQDFGIFPHASYVPYVTRLAGSFPCQSLALPYRLLVGHGKWIPLVALTKILLWQSQCGLAFSFSFPPLYSLARVRGFGE